MYAFYLDESKNWFLNELSPTFFSSNLTYMFAFQPDNTYKHLKHRRLLIVKQLNKSRVKLAHNGTEKRVFRPQCSFDVTAQI